MTSIVIALVAFIFGVAVGSGFIVSEIHLLRAETLTELQRLTSEVQVQRFKLDSEIHKLHQRLQNLGGTLSSDFKDVVSGKVGSSKEA